MAELLIRAIDNIHRDPVKDREGCYKEGDPVIAMPDGHRWGRCEHLWYIELTWQKGFYRLRVPGVEPWHFRAYCAPAHALGLIRPGLEPAMLRRRAYSIKAALLPKRARELYLLGEIPNITWDEFQGACLLKDPKHQLIHVAA